MNDTATTAHADMIARLNAHIASLSVARAAYGQVGQLGFEIRTRYALVFAVQGSFRSAVHFVDLANGDIYRADSWRARGRLMQTAGV